MIKSDVFIKKTLEGLDIDGCQDLSVKLLLSFIKGEFTEKNYRNLMRHIAEYVIELKDEKSIPTFYKILVMVEDPFSVFNSVREYIEEDKDNAPE